MLPFYSQYLVIPHWLPSLLSLSFLIYCFLSHVSLVFSTFLLSSIVKLLSTFSLVSIFFFLSFFSFLTFLPFHRCLYFYTFLHIFFHSLRSLHSPSILFSLPSLLLTISSPPTLYLLLSLHPRLFSPPSLSFILSSPSPFHFYIHFFRSIHWLHPSLTFIPSLSLSFTPLIHLSYSIHFSLTFIPSIYPPSPRRSLGQFTCDYLLVLSPVLNYPGVGSQAEH